MTAEWFGASEKDLSAAFAVRLVFEGVGAAAAFATIPLESSSLATFLLIGLALSRQLL